MTHKLQASQAGGDNMLSIFFFYENIRSMKTLQIQTTIATDFKKWYSITDVNFL